MDNSEPKSAYEIAMERLRRRDAEEGVEHTPLTGEQRTAIAEVRTFYQAKLAEMEVLHQSSLRRTPDPEAQATLERDYRHERERLVAEREARIARIRAGQA